MKRIHLLFPLGNVFNNRRNPGIRVFENVARRASRALERHVRGSNKNSADVDPFGDTGEHPTYKPEEEW
mgnify:CR=1 FL=1